MLVDIINDNFTQSTHDCNTKIFSVVDNYVRFFTNYVRFFVNQSKKSFLSRKITIVSGGEMAFSCDIADVVFF